MIQGGIQGSPFLRDQWNKYLYTKDEGHHPFSAGIPAKEFIKDHKGLQGALEGDGPAAQDHQILFFISLFVLCKGWGTKQRMGQGLSDSQGRSRPTGSTAAKTGQEENPWELKLCKNQQWRMAAEGSGDVGFESARSGASKTKKKRNSEGFLFPILFPDNIFFSSSWCL